MKLIIANGTYETLTDESVTLVVNGVNASADKSVDNTDCAKQAILMMLQHKH